MRVEDHWLTDPPDGITIERKPIYGEKPEITPEILVIHYAVTDSINATVAAQQHQGYGAHLTIDGHPGEGVQVVQHLPFNQRAGHAGRSKYQGRDAVNGFSIGVEIANPGPIVGGKTVWGMTWPEELTTPGVHKSGLVPQWKHWAAYTDEETDFCAHLAELLKQTYGITDVVGHDDVSPGRKFDPGPAFPMAWLRRTVFGTTESEEP